MLAPTTIDALSVSSEADLRIRSSTTGLIIRDSIGRDASAAREYELTNRILRGELDVSALIELKRARATRAARAARQAARTKVDWGSQPLGEISDVDLAKRLKVSPDTVGRARRARRVEAYREPLRPRGVHRIYQIGVSFDAMHPVSCARALTDKSAPGPEALAIAKDIREQLDKALGSLPPLLGDLLNRIYFKGYTPAEVGLHLGVPLDQVSDLHSKAIQRLRHAGLEGLRD